ncbi:MAG: hypothetical protein Q9209_005864 [Squamulea sp. 1 TL-2023]
MPPRQLHDSPATVRVSQQDTSSGDANRSTSASKTPNNKRKRRDFDDTGVKRMSQTPHKRTKHRHNAVGDVGHIVSNTNDTSPRARISRHTSSCLGQAAESPHHTTAFAQSSPASEQPGAQASPAPLPMDNKMISQDWDIQQRKYRLSREAKPMESIEHVIDPGNPRHSAYPRDDPLVENLNDHNSYHPRSQVNDPDYVSEDASPPSSDPSYVPSPTARNLNQKPKEGDSTTRTHCAERHSEGTTSPEEELASLIRAKREKTAALEVASSHEPLGQTISHFEGRPMDGRSEHEAAEIANLIREVAAITRRLDDLMALHLKQQSAPQGQARREGNVWPQTGEVAIRDCRWKLHAPMNEPSGKMSDRQFGKSAVRDGPVQSIGQTNQHNDKQSSSPLTATSSDRMLRSVPPTDRIMGVGGSTKTSSKSSKHRGCEALQSSDRAHGGSPAPLARGLMHEWDTFQLPKTPSPTKGSKKRRLGQRRRQSSTMSRCNGITKHNQRSNVKGLPPKQMVKPVPPLAQTQDPTTSYGGPVPPSDIQGTDIGSLQHKAMSTTKLASVGPDIRPADSSRYQAKPTTEQLAHNSNVGSSDQIASDTSTQGQIFGSTLCQDHLSDAAIAGSQSTNSRDSSSGRQDQDPQEEASHSVRRLSASRECSELPDFETLLAEVGVYRKSLNNPSISTAVGSQLGELRGTSYSATMAQTDDKLTTDTPKACPVLPQSDTTKKGTPTVARPSQPPQPSVSLGALGLSKAPSKSPHQKVNGNDTSESGIPGAHVQKPQNQYVVRQGMAAVNASLPSFQRVQKQRNRTPGRRFSSSPNTIDVHARSQSVRERYFVQRYVKPTSIAHDPGMSTTNSTNSIPVNRLGDAQPIRPRTGSSGVYSRKCQCSYLPSYFRNPRYLKPSLETWWGGKLEFLTHCLQIVTCPAHPDITHRACRAILDSEQYNGENFEPGPLHNTHNRQYQNQMKRHDHWNKSSQQRAQVKGFTEHASTQNIDHNSNSGLERCTNTKVADTDALARPEPSNNSTVSSAMGSGGLPPFRMPLGLSLSPSPTGNEVTIGQNVSNSDGSSKWKNQSSKSNSYKIPNGLPTPVDTSSPDRVEYQETLHLTDDDYAPNWSLPSSPTRLYGIAPQSSVLDESGKTGIPVPTPKDPILANSKVAPKSSKKILKAVVINNNPNATNRGPGINTKPQDMHQDGGNSSAVRPRQTQGSPIQCASHSVRRHATEPPIISGPVSPATAVRRALQNPPRLPLLSLNSSILNQQQPATASDTCKKPARPLHETTPPPTPPNTRKKRYIPLDERKKLQPELSRYVEKDKRLSDELLIEVGRERLKYARHSAAPYAFSYDGKLYEEYHCRLTKMVDDDGKPLWDKALVKRLTKK